MDTYIQENQSLWDTWAELHQESSTYDIEGFLDGRSSLREVELEELGDVQNKSLLHLQCHFGMDTLSWARLGARVTGVDLSARAIHFAQELASKAELEARFIQSPLLDLELTETYDIVFTSYGTIVWLDDLSAWARLIAKALNDGGVFYMVDFHPMAQMLSDDAAKLVFPYFYRKQPIVYEEKGSYGAVDAQVEKTSYTWSHTLGDVVSQLINAGLRIEFLHEFPFAVYDCFPWLEQGDAPERFVLKQDAAVRTQEAGELPLMFSIRASKP